MIMTLKKYLQKVIQRNHFSSEWGMNFKNSVELLPSIKTTIYPSLRYSDAAIGPFSYSFTEAMCSYPCCSIFFCDAPVATIHIVMPSCFGSYHSGKKKPVQKVVKQDIFDEAMRVLNSTASAENKRITEEKEQREKENDERMRHALDVLWVEYLKNTVHEARDSTMASEVKS